MTATAARTREQADARGTTREFLSFRLGAESYGIDILKVREIRGYEPPTGMPNAPDWLKGVANLRGAIVPIVDLRTRFGLDARFDVSTVVIILSLTRHLVGVVVDSVSDVLMLAPEHVLPPPAFASSTFGTDYITGLGTGEDGLLILLDIEKLMTGADLALVATGGAAAATRPARDFHHPIEEIHS